MSVTYAIDTNRALIRTRCSAKVTLPEVLAHFQSLSQDPDCPAHLDVLLDFREIEALPTSDQLRSVSEEIRRIRDRVQFGACAIVAGNDALFGTAMVFEVYAARVFRVTKVFREVADADIWLAHQHKTSRQTP
jgi:hypothetical protein